MKNNIECYEFLVEIRHRYPILQREYMFRDFEYQNIDHFSNVMIFQNKVFYNSHKEINSDRSSV